MLQVVKLSANDRSKYESLREIEGMKSAEVERREQQRIVITRKWTDCYWETSRRSEVVEWGP